MTFRHAIPVLALAALAAGCGGKGASPGVANLGAAATSTTSASSANGGGGSKPENAVQFSSCMRSHGVTNFPDPSAGGGLSLSPSMGVNPDSPTFQAAQRACRSLLHITPPNPAQQAAMQAQALKFSACMRSHGLPSFPDPQFGNGTVRLKLNASQGIDPNNPVFQAAQKACQKDAPIGKAGRFSTSTKP
jgi:hypothetical protein